MRLKLYPPCPFSISHSPSPLQSHYYHHLTRTGRNLYVARVVAWERRKENKEFLWNFVFNPQHGLLSRGLLLLAWMSWHPYHFILFYFFSRTTLTHDKRWKWLDYAEILGRNAFIYFDQYFLWTVNGIKSHVKPQNALTLISVKTRLSWPATLLHSL